MASDLKIEIFAFKLFHEMWYANQVTDIFPDFVETYGDDCVGDDSNIEACDDLFAEAMNSRINIYSLVNDPRNSIEEIKKLKSLSDVYEYITRICDEDDIFCHLSIFERMFATIDFVRDTCCLLYDETDSFTEIIRYGHVIWAMYFDKFTAEFYEKGGWSELKREANRYKLLSEFDGTFFNNTSFYLSRIKEATVNYTHFKKFVDFQEQKFNHKVHVSKLWIQFQIENFGSYIHIPRSYNISVNLFEVELLLEDLKLIFDYTNLDPYDIKISTDQHEASTVSAKLSYSKNHCVSDEMKANPDDETQIQNLSVNKEYRIIEKTPGEFSHTFTDFGESQNGNMTSVMKESTFDNIDTNGNSKLDINTSIEMEPLKQTSSTDTPKDSQVEQNILPAVDTKKLCERINKNLPTASDLDLSLSCRSEPYVSKNEDITNECFYESNVDKQADATNTDQVPTGHEMEKNEYHKDSSSHDQTMSLVLDFVNESKNNVNEMENPKDTLKMSCSKKGHIKTSETKNDPSVSQNVASNAYGLACSVNENLYSADEIEKITKAREVLRNERKDPEVRNFVRMIMVLGDTEGTKYLLSMFENSKEQSKNSKKKSNKKKKRK